MASAGTSWITTELAPIFERAADHDRPEQLGARADHHLVADGRVALAAREAGAAERHALVHRHVVADLGRLADHDAGPVVDEEPASDAGGGMDLHAGDHLHHVGEHARDQRDARLVQRVRDAVGQQRLDAAVGEQDLDPADAARSRVALLRRREVVAHLLDHPRECRVADHGAKNGVLT